MVTIAALRARFKGWQPDGTYTLGKWAYPINIVAILYQLFGIVIMVYPHYSGVSWLDNYIVLLGVAVIYGVGLIYMLVGRPWGTSDQPFGDAITMHHKKAAAPAPVSGAPQEAS